MRNGIAAVYEYKRFMKQVQFLCSYAACEEARNEEERPTRFFMDEYVIFFS